MSQSESEYFIGKVVQIKRNKNSKSNLIQVQNEDRKVDCQINFFCPLEVGDSIAVDDYMRIEGDIYLFTKQPIVLIGKDEDTIKRLIFLAFPKNKSEGFKIFHSLQNDAKQFRKPYLDYINDISCRWASATPIVRERLLRNKFKDFDSKLIRNFLKLWYKKRILRQFYLFGFTKTEIKTLQEFHPSEKNLALLFQDFIGNPYMFFTIKQEKIDEIAKKLQKDDASSMYLYSVLRNLYLQFCSGRNGYPIDEFCQQYPDTLLKIDPWITKHKGYIYFKSIFEKEKEVAEKLQICSTLESPFDSDDVFDELKDLSQDQQEAVKGLLSSSLGIVSGPAGSGKTTILRKIVSMLESRGEKVAIASFTGKAVARLRQVLQRSDPQTLHFLLKKPIDFDVLIIDEASMVSSSLLHQVLTSFDDSFKLYLIGDVSQLPPIEWGRPFFDLIQTKKIPTFFLTKCHRFYEQSGEVNGILENANGMIEDSNWKWSERKNFKILKNSSVLKVIETAIENNISMFDFTVLCPFNKPLHDINQRASKLFLPDKEEVVDLNGRTWRIGDRVINLKNRYDLNIMNGDDGVVMDFIPQPNHESNKLGLKIRFGELLLDFLFSTEVSLEETKESMDEVDEDFAEKDPDEKEPPTTKHLVQSYAMTVHKSQGSEWDYVLLYLPYDNRGFVTKNLFYTAITRARKCLWIIAENQTMLNRIIQLQSEFGKDALTVLY